MVGALGIALLLIFAQLGVENFCPTIGQAVDAYQARHGIEPRDRMDS